MDKKSWKNYTKKQKLLRVSHACADRERSSATECESFADLFQGLDDEPPELHINRPVVLKQNSGSTVYRSAFGRQMVEQEASKPSLTDGWESDLVSSRSSSPFEVVHDEAGGDWEEPRPLKSTTQDLCKLTEADEPDDLASELS